MAAYARGLEISVKRQCRRRKRFSIIFIAEVAVYKNIQG